MPGLLEGKLALILGIANKWSLAYGIAQAFCREGASLVLTYRGDRQRDAIESLASDMGVDAVLLYRIRAERAAGGVQVFVVDVASGRTVVEDARSTAERLGEVLRDRTRRAVRVYLARMGDPANGR